MKIRVRKSMLIILPILIIGSVAVGCNPWLLASLLLFTAILNACSFDFSRHIFFIFFLVAFFVFMMGGQVANDFFGYPMKYVSTNEEYNYLNFCIFLSLSFILLGYIVGEYVEKHTPRIADNQRILNQRNYLKIISKYTFFILAIAWFAVLLEQISVVRGSQYVELYTFKSRLPGFVDQMSEACPLALCLFYGTFPSKREARWVNLAVIAYAFLSILCGRRIFFVTYLLLVIGYAVARTALSKGEEVWISKKQIVLLVLLAPAAIVFLYSYRYIRYGKSTEANSVLEAFIGFFAQQGFSANLIVTGRKYADSLGDHVFSFLSTIRFLRINVFTRKVLGLDYTYLYNGDLINRALNSGSFARIISYILIPGLYQKGYGLGSCYIAELYHDFGYAGICLGNFCYGLILGRIIVLKRNKVLRNMVALSLFLRFLMAPRYNFDYPFVVLISLNFWGYMIVVYILLTILKKSSGQTRLSGPITGIQNE